MRKKVGIIKRMFCILLIFLFSINSFAAVVSDNDGSAFITKAEFDSLKTNFQAQIDAYNTAIDAKIDGAIAQYLAGIQIGGEHLEVDWVRPFPSNTTGMLGGVYTELLGNAQAGQVKNKGGYTFVGRKLNGSAFTWEEMIMFKGGDNFSWQWTSLTDYERIQFKTNGRVTPFWYVFYAPSAANLCRILESDTSPGVFCLTNQGSIFARTDYHPLVPDYFMQSGFVNSTSDLWQKDGYLDIAVPSAVPLAQIHWNNQEGPFSSDAVYIPLLHVSAGSGALRFKWYFGNSEFAAEYKALYNMWNDEKTMTDGEYSYVHKSGTKVWLALRQNDAWVELTPSTGNLFLDYTYDDDSWKSTADIDVRTGDIIYIATTFSANHGAMQSAAKFIMKYDNLNP